MLKQSLDFREIIKRHLEVGEALVLDQVHLEAIDYLLAEAEAYHLMQSAGEESPEESDGMTSDDIEWIHEKVAMERHIATQDEQLENLKKEHQKEVEQRQKHFKQILELREYKRSYELIVAELIKQKGGN